MARLDALSAPIQTARATIDLISIFCPNCGEAQANPADGALTFAASDLERERETYRPGRVIACNAGGDGCGARFRLPSLIGKL